MQAVETPANPRLVVCKQKSKLAVSDIKQQLTYVLISTQPGRKFESLPVMALGDGDATLGQKTLQFEYRKCEGISQETEGYCAIGFTRDLKQVAEVIISKPPVSVGQRVLYISKINVAFKPASKTYFVDQRQKYNFNLSTLPPTDINASEIQQFLEKVIQLYGPISKVDVKRNCLMLFYQDELKIKQSFFVKGIKRSETGQLILTYWAITHHRTLYTYEPRLLIQFPAKPKIRHFLVHSEWLVMATDNQVVFLHLYRPTQLFLNLNDIKIQAIQQMDQDKVILFEYKYFYVYQLFTFKNPHLYGKAKTKKIEPYTVAFKKKTALFAGINYSSLLNEPVKQKQIHVIENFTTCNLMNKSFIPDKKLQICNKDEATPVKNMKYLSKQDLFICSCGESVYLFHLETSSLIASVDLSSTVQKLYQIDYPINIVNCMVKVRNEKKLVRISFEQYAEVIGTEVTCMEKYGDCVDFYASGKQIYSTDGDMLVIYGASEKSRVMYSNQSEGSRIKKLSMSGDFFTFLLCNESIMEAYFMEL